MSEALRAQHEKEAYDHGDVLAASAALHDRFWHVFRCPNTQAAEQYFQRRMNEASACRSVLDLGCNDGRLLATLQSDPHRVAVGIDISERGIKQARLQQQCGTEYCVMDGHNLAFKNDSFEAVVGRSILHHLVYKRAMLEIYRILRPGGLALFFEPLRDNPTGKILRRLTPNARTADELPLSRRQIVWADELFGSEAHMFVGMTSVPLGMLTSVVSSNPGNALLRAAHRLDDGIAHTPLKYWMRSAVLVWKKQ